MPALTWNPTSATFYPRHDVHHALYDSFQMFNSHHHPHQNHQQHIQHKLWILDCRSCGSFLTNRGMKVPPNSLPQNQPSFAHLRTRPNVALFSTDALPVNCSAYSSNPDALRSPIFPPSYTIPRTCECLTQTLCCHSCGSAVGYMIVLPVRFLRLIAPCP